MASFFRHSLTLRLLSIAIVFSAWEYAGRIPISPAFPTFLETMSALYTMIADGSMAKVYPATFQPLFLGLVISSILGVGCGITHVISFRLPV